MPKIEQNLNPDLSKRKKEIFENLDYQRLQQLTLRVAEQLIKKLASASVSAEVYYE